MADAPTLIADVIDPEILAQMIVLKLPNNTILVPGVFTTNEFPIGEKGTRWKIPYNNNLGDLETFIEDTNLTIQGMDQDDYSMVIIRKAAIYAAGKIVRLAAHADPMDFVATQLSTQVIPKMYMDTQILVMEGGIPDDNRYDGSAANMSAAAVRAAKLKLGDKMAGLKHILMHSKQFGDLDVAKEVVYQAQNSILPIYETQVTNVGLPHTPNMIATVAGLVIHVSDNCPLGDTSPETYIAYLMGDAPMGHFWQQGLNIDLYRDVKKKTDWISPDLDFTMCIHGVDYTSDSYTNANLENMANYDDKWDQKLIKLVRMKTL